MRLLPGAERVPIDRKPELLATQNIAGGARRSWHHGCNGLKQRGRPGWPNLEELTTIGREARIRQGNHGHNAGGLDGDSKKYRARVRGFSLWASMTALGRVGRLVAGCRITN